MLRLLLFGISLLLMTACQTSPLRDFDKVQLGMDKDTVLKYMGTPKASVRLHDKDRWLYRFYDSGIRFDKEIHFLDGIVCYSGEPWQPAPEKRAVEVDKKNEEIEAQRQAIIAERERQYQENKVALEKLEKEHKGTEKVIYVPSFEEIK